MTRAYQAVIDQALQLLGSEGKFPLHRVDEAILWINNTIPSNREVELICNDTLNSAQKRTLVSAAISLLEEIIPFTVRLVPAHLYEMMTMIDEHTNRRHGRSRTRSYRRRGSTSPESVSRSPSYRRRRSTSSKHSVSLSPELRLRSRSFSRSPRRLSASPESESKSARLKRKRSASPASPELQPRSRSFSRSPKGKKKSFARVNTHLLFSISGTNGVIITFGCSSSHHQPASKFSAKATSQVCLC